MSDTPFANCTRTEVVFSRDTFARLLHDAFPLTIHFGGAEEKHSLVLTDLEAVRLVAELGLRVECRAQFHWPLLGVDLPVEVTALTLMLLPTIERGTDGDSVVFRLSIERADFALLPAAIDARVKAALNTRLAGKRAEVSWSFSNALSHAWRLPGIVEPSRFFAIRPAGAVVQVTEDSVTYTVFFETSLPRSGTALVRDSREAATRPEPASAPATQMAVHGSPLWTRLRPPDLRTAGFVGLLALAAYFLARCGTGAL